MSEQTKRRCGPAGRDGGLLMSVDTRQATLKHVSVICQDGSVHIYPAVDTIHSGIFFVSVRHAGKWHRIAGPKEVIVR